MTTTTIPVATIEMKICNGETLIAILKILPMKYVPPKRTALKIEAIIAKSTFSLIIIFCIALLLKPNAASNPNC